MRKENSFEFLRFFGVFSRACFPNKEEQKKSDLHHQLLTLVSTSLPFSSSYRARSRIVKSLIDRSRETRPSTYVP